MSVPGDGCVEHWVKKWVRGEEGEGVETPWERGAQPAVGGGRVIR